MARMQLPLLLGSALTVGALVGGVLSQFRTLPQAQTAPVAQAQTAAPDLPSGKTIRVLVSRQLSAETFEGKYVFPSVSLIPTGGSVQISTGPDRQRLKPVVTVFADKPVQFVMKDGRMVARFEGLSFPLDKVARLSALPAVRYRLVSTTRQGLVPEYPGGFWLEARGNGMLVVNTVDLQDYLKRVLPSEMPATFHPEALKAQAVAARTYAVSRQRDAGSFWKTVGADVDDSVAEQVYNNVLPVPQTDEAVGATRNQYLSFGGETVQTFYFSTSPGSTADIAEVWPDRLAQPYLKARTQTNPLEVSIGNEAEALEFFKGRDPEGFFDGASPLWRWKVSLSREELEAIFAKTLPTTAKNAPDFVKTPEGPLSPDAPDFKLGSLQTLKVNKRAAGGYVVELELGTTTGRYVVGRESNVRNLVRPNKTFTGGEDVVLERFNAEPRLNFSALPSAAFALEEERDAEGKLLRVTFWGGGFGHGVGMSQFGADGLGRKGRTYKEILQHFYPGTELTTLGN